jgi:hypothetical protein
MLERECMRWSSLWIYYLGVTRGLVDGDPELNADSVISRRLGSLTIHYTFYSLFQLALPYFSRRVEYLLLVGDVRLTYCCWCTVDP